MQDYCRAFLPQSHGSLCRPGSAGYGLRRLDCHVSFACCSPADYCAGYRRLLPLPCTPLRACRCSLSSATVSAAAPYHLPSCGSPVYYRLQQRGTRYALTSLLPYDAAARYHRPRQGVSAACLPRADFWTPATLWFPVGHCRFNALFLPTRLVMPIASPPYPSSAVPAFPCQLHWLVNWCSTGCYPRTFCHSAIPITPLRTLLWGFILRFPHVPGITTPPPAVRYSSAVSSSAVFPTVSIIHTGFGHFYSRPPLVGLLYLDSCLWIRFNS